MKQVKLLLIEDDAVDRMAFERSVREERLPYVVTVATSVTQAKAALKAEAFDIIISDYRLGDGTAFDILSLGLDTQVIITTGAGDEQVAVQAMKAGAWDYIIKDPDRRYMQLVPVAIQRAIDRKRSEDRCLLLNEHESAEAAVIGGPGLAETLKLVDLAATSDSPVFITGETGTGKNLVAKAIHHRSALRAAPFIGINCAAIPEQLIEGELFGYEKGAFTGATGSKKGIFELAVGGSLLLDELGEMPVHLQSKLLGVLDDKKVRRLGSESARAVDVRVMATTNVDLEKVLGKTFRLDLFYRLSVIRITVPPLRERRQDIPQLCAHLLRKLNPGSSPTLADGELERLMDYTWPGNVRELKNILDRSIILHRGGPLRPSELVTARPGSTPPTVVRQDMPGTNGTIRTLDEVEQAHIRQTFAHFSGNIARTARALGISLSTLKRKLKQQRAGDPTQQVHSA